MAENSNMITANADKASDSVNAAASVANVSDSNIGSIAKEAGASSGISVKEEADIKLETPDKDDVIDTINKMRI